MCVCESCPVMSDSLQPHGLYNPWDSPGQNTGVGSCSLLQGSSQPRDWTQMSHTAGRFFTSWATREANGILHSHWKEWNKVISRCVDEPRVSHTEWSKSEREKQILHIIAFMWNLKTWYRLTYFQGRNRDADVENRHLDTGRRWRRWIERLGLTHIYTTMCKINSKREAAV